jgi:hypothetical protein
MKKKQLSLKKKKNFQEGVLHGIFEFAPLREPDLKLVLAHGRRLSA